MSNRLRLLTEPFGRMKPSSDEAAEPLVGGKLVLPTDLKPSDLNKDVKVLSGSTILNHGSRIRAYYSKAKTREDAQSVLAYLGEKFRKKPTRYSLALRTSDKKYCGHSGGIRGLRLQSMLKRFECIDTMLIVFEWENGPAPGRSEGSVVLLVMQAARDLLGSLTSAASSARLPKIVHRSARSHRISEGSACALAPPAPADAGVGRSIKTCGIGTYGPKHPLRNLASVSHSTTGHLNAKHKRRNLNPFHSSVVRKSNAWTTSSFSSTSGFSPCSRNNPIALVRRKLKVKPLEESCHSPQAETRLGFSWKANKFNMRGGDSRENIRGDGPPGSQQGLRSAFYCRNRVSTKSNSGMGTRRPRSKRVRPMSHVSVRGLGMGNVRGTSVSQQTMPIFKVKEPFKFGGHRETSGGNEIAKLKSLSRLRVGLS